MKRIILLLALLFTLPLTAFHFGVGFGWNTIDETFNSNLFTNENRSGQDRYGANTSRLSPVVQLGYRFELCNEWSMGLLAQWKYLNFKTNNAGSSRGQLLPNASFSSINFFGPGIERDFASKTRLNNEVILLAYVGKQVMNGCMYFGIGPALLTGSNTIYLTAVHTPNAVGDHLLSTYVASHKIVWGGAGQVGYLYCVGANTFLNLSCTYLQTAYTHFNNSVNAAVLNGADTPGPTILFLNRQIKFCTQELMCTLNLAF